MPGESWQHTRWRNTAGPGHIGGTPAPEHGSTRTGRVGRFARPWAPSAIPKVCWTGSPTGATIKLHPVYDTVKGAAVVSNLPVRDRRCARLLRCRPITAQPANASRPAQDGNQVRRDPRRQPSTTEIRRPTARHIQRRACPCPPDRADRDRGHPKPEHPGIKTALSKPDNSGS
jgi:hypothetical protein